MALSIKSERAERLARERAALTGESITATVESALAERLETERRRRRRRAGDDVVERFRALPVLEDRAVEDIRGYGPRLNFGDVFFARRRRAVRQPSALRRMLFVGDDFTHTDVAIA